jgi:hypothetical protein
MLWAGVAGLSCLVLVQPAHALRIAGPPPVPQRLAQADAIVVGKITAVEEKTVRAERSPDDKDKAEYRVVVVKIGESLAGIKGLTHIKVGYVLPQEAPPETGTPGRPIRPGFRLQPVRLNKGQEVCLFLKEHPKESFYVVNSSMDVLDKNSPNYEKQLKELRQYAKIAANPAAALSSRNADERLKAAATLIYRYRTYRGMGKTEPIPFEESKKILQVLAGANWNVAATRDGQINALTLFSLLGATPEDGWTQPADFSQFPAAAKTWLTAHADSFRIQRFVDTPTEKK